jgi:hypothetical protein
VSLENKLEELKQEILNLQARLRAAEAKRAAPEQGREAAIEALRERAAKKDTSHGRCSTCGRCRCCSGRTFWGVGGGGLTEDSTLRRSCC